MSNFIKENRNEQIRIFRKLTYPGTNCLAYAKDIRSWIQKNKIKTLLDYGCGEGLQYEKKFSDLIGLNKLDIDLYDIGSNKYGKLSNSIYEGILAIDVFQYIPENLLEYELNELYSRLNGHLFVVIDVSGSDQKTSTLSYDPAWWDEVFTSFPHQAEVIYHSGSRKQNGKRVYKNCTRII